MQQAATTASSLWEDQRRSIHYTGPAEERLICTSKVKCILYKKKKGNDLKQKVQCVTLISQGKILCWGCVRVCLIRYSYSYTQLTDLSHCQISRNVFI